MKLVLVFVGVVMTAAATAAEVIEVGRGQEGALPGGKEADGIWGDFVLRSDRVEAVVSGNLPNRRANMSTFYGEDGVSPGLLYDLTLRGENNDQLVAYGPCGHGPVSYVRAVEGEEAVVESVTTAALNKGVFKRHEYRVRDGESGIWIATTLRNESGEVVNVSTGDDLVRFNASGTAVGGIRWVDAINPAHRCGYALVVDAVEGIEKWQGSVTLRPGQEVRVRRFFAVASSPAGAVSECLVRAGGETRVLAGRICEADGGPVSEATIDVPVGGSTVPGYTDEEGRFAFQVPAAAAVAAFKVRAIGREVTDFRLGSAADEETVVVMSAAAGIQFEITDAESRDLPCKAMFEGIDGTPAPDLGPKERAHGCVDQYHSERGSFFVALDPGRYVVTVVRGPEYGLLKQEVEVTAGRVAAFRGQLVRQVDTRGWISADFHNHSTPSGDNVCDTDGRVISLAAEHIEFAPTTEHNRLSDWGPTIEALGLSPFLATVKGVELTGRGQHFNAFPFEPEPFRQDGGAPEWSADPRIAALTLRRWQGEDPTRWIQLNHPSLSDLFVDRDGDGVADGGFVGLGTMVDGSESQNFRDSMILSEAPFVVQRSPGAVAAKVTIVREFLWRQLLNQGQRLVAVAVADAHTVHGNGVGGWRIYLPSPTDEPSKIRWQELSPHAKAGHIVLSTGPFLEVTTAEGAIAGDDTRAAGAVELRVKVQCADWQDIDRVQVLVNSRPDPALLFTRATHPAMFRDGVVKFEESLTVRLQRDAHLIVVADHQTMTLKAGFGTSDQSVLRPCAYNNPIYVDVDGGGFQPNGDDLGFPLPGSKVTADEAKTQLIRAGLMAPVPTVQDSRATESGAGAKP